MHIFDPADMDTVFSALASSSRRQLLDALYRDNGQTLLQLCSTLEMSRQAASKHLALLERAGLVVTLWRGREKLHFLNPVPLQAIYERWIRKFEGKRLDALHALKAVLEEEPPSKEKRNG
jgi:DNA-binding transcriptional ArsR family regulator